MAFGTFYLFADRVAHKDSLYGRTAARQASILGARSYFDAERGVARLVIDQPLVLGTHRLLYRGFEPDGRIRIDVVVPALDPHTAYPYRFTLSEAREGFRMADRHLRLRSARGDRIRLEAIPGG
jgi:hypothetical protein